MDTVVVDEAAGLRANLRGSLLLPDEPGYDEARAIWNAMIDKRPGMIVRCAGAADVRTALNFAREHRLALAVRGGGHNIAGSALVNDGVVIDLSMMRSVRIDPQARHAWVEGGALLRDVDHEAQAWGLATPLGINSTTGVAGPGGGSPEKPVGTVYIALATPVETIHRKLRLAGSRDRITSMSAGLVLDLLRRHLQAENGPDRT